MAERNASECPVDFIPINENQARFTALFVFLLILFYLVTGYWQVTAFLALDFLLRSTTLGRFSILGRLSGVAVSGLRIANKPTDRAPKRFAALVGLLFTATITILHLAEVSFIPYILADVLALFAFLEAAFAFCAGCMVYALFKPLLLHKN